MSKRHTYTLVAHTPAVGKFLRDEPTYSPGGRQPPLEAFGPLLVPLVESNSPENGQNAHFLTFSA